MPRELTVNELRVASIVHDFVDNEEKSLEIALLVLRAITLTPEMRAAAEKAMFNVLVTKDNIATVYWPAAIAAMSPTT